ncbi:MAG: FAD-linked oxidase C-terminal domain-containing protein [Planctomycetota bacterium]
MAFPLPVAPAGPIARPEREVSAGGCNASFAPPKRPPTSTHGQALAQLLAGEVYDDSYSRSLYATDASIYEIEPQVVAYPRDRADVVAAVRYCQSQKLPIVGRGGGSGLAGETLTTGVVLDLTVHMNHILWIDPAAQTVRVQPGVVLATLNAALAPYGLYYTPDPSSHNRATVGGVLGNNATGAHSIKLGAARNWVTAMETVVSNGQVFEARPMTLASADWREVSSHRSGFVGQIHRDTAAICAEYETLIAERQPKTTRNRSGYLMKGVLHDGAIDLTQLLVGSEGTLGICTEATLQLRRKRSRQVLCMLHFATLLDACRAVPRVLTTDPDTCEMLDRHVMDLGREARPAIAHVLRKDAGACLMVEYEGDEAAPLLEKAQALAGLFQPAGQYMVTSLEIMTEPEAMQNVWEIRKAAVPMLFKKFHGRQPIPVIEDVAVPPDRLAEYVAHVEKVFAENDLTVVAYAHAGHGELHIRPYLDLRQAGDVDRLETIATAIYRKVWELGGTISGEHGEGLVRAQFIKDQYGPLYEVFKLVKGVWDPNGIFNPDKKITHVASLMKKNLRYGAEYKFDDARTLLHWAPGELSFEVEKCNGCAHCRDESDALGMCPRFKVNRVEDASPRAKANLMRRILAGRHKEGDFTAQETAEILDFCFNCKLCTQGCPSNVNIPKIVQEMRYRHVEKHGLPIDLQVLCLSEPATKLGVLSRWVANWANRQSLLRWGMEKIMGIDRRRTLPAFHKPRWKLNRARPGLEGSTGASGRTAVRPPVVLFPDLYATYNAPEIAQAAIDVLEHNGFQVIIPPGIRWCGMPLIEYGKLVAARELIYANLDALAPYANNGIPIVLTEPTATLCLKQEWLDLVETPAAHAVAEQAQDICDFLAEQKKDGRLRTDFKPVPVAFGYHEPCHHKELRIGKPGVDLLREIPGVTVEVINKGCCGIAGTFGMRKKYYEESMAIGSGLFGELGKDSVQLGLSECSTCRIQMEHGARKATIHPIQVLAEAYGLSRISAPALEATAAGTVR